MPGYPVVWRTVNGRLVAGKLEFDPHVMRFINGGRATPRSEIENELLPAFLSYYECSAGYGFWAAIEKATGRFVGWFHFRPTEGAVSGEVELGYRLRRFSWGNGYATEGSRALIDQGFARLGVERVVAYTMVVNVASRRVMEKAGLRFVRVFRQPWPDYIADSTGSVGLVSGGATVGSLVLPDEARVSERWERLHEALLPQLATALESTQLVAEVHRRHVATIAALSRSMEAKDHYTGGHTERVAEISVALARRLGLQGADIDAIEVGALLHDIGKIGIPEGVLHKPGALDESEWEIMRQHPVISDYILSEIDLHPFVRQIARWAHERMGATGYPDALPGNEIPLSARIVSVADALDALTSDRPYRKARPLAAALIELREHVGTQFCPDVVAALEAVVVEEPDALGFEPRPQPVSAAAV